jgi:hypothetical protein
MIGFFAVSWMASIGIYKWRRYDEIELNASFKNPVCADDPPVPPG